MNTPAEFLWTLGATGAGKDIAGSAWLSWTVVLLCSGVNVFAWSVSVWWWWQGGHAKTVAGRRAKRTMAMIWAVGGFVGFGIRGVMMVTPAWGPFVLLLAVCLGLVGWLNWQIYAGRLDVSFVSRADLEEKAHRLRTAAVTLTPPEQRDVLEQMAAELLLLVYPPPTPPPGG